MTDLGPILLRLGAAAAILIGIALAVLAFLRATAVQWGGGPRPNVWPEAIVAGALVSGGLVYLVLQ